MEKQIAVIGTGYVGLVTGTCLAEMGHNVVCYDSDQDKLAWLRQSLKAPFYEPGLNELIEHTTQLGNLHFAEDKDEFLTSLETTEVCFICVGTPPAPGGKADLSQVRSVLGFLKDYSYDGVVVIKSTVPPGTCDHLSREFGMDISVNPEFLAEGRAIEDFKRPDRIVIGSHDEGGDHESEFEVMRDVYSYLIRNGHTYLEMTPTEAELVKYASNAMLATRVSFINEIARICDSVGADIMSVRKGIGSDSRIGSKFLYPGIGYGGSCFKKDLYALLNVAGDTDTPVLDSVGTSNDQQREYLYSLLFPYLNPEVYVAIWGLSFKPRTSDTRDAPAVWLINRIREFKRITVYDPAANSDAYHKLPVRPAKDKYHAVEGANVLILCTEWAEFRNVDWKQVKDLMEPAPAIIDGRNQYDPQELARLGFEYIGIGRGKWSAYGGRVRDLP